MKNSICPKLSYREKLEKIYMELDFRQIEFFIGIRVLKTWFSKHGYFPK